VGARIHEREHRTYRARRSRWTIPWRCAATSASAIWIAIRNASLTGTALQGLTVDVLHDQIVRSDVIELADAGMIEGGDRPRLAREALRVFALEAFDRDRAME
jgi:hypothetical protein